MSNKLEIVLLDIFRILSFNQKLDFTDNGSIKINTSGNENLFTLTPNSISIPIPDFYETFVSHKSKLGDHIVDLQLLQKLIEKLNKENKLVRLNHVGFCYKVASIEEEVKRIRSALKEKAVHTYEEPSNDSAKWLFFGDTTNWSDPLVELVPLEKSDDQWIEYWLPHIQIDIDTELSPEEIREHVKSFFGTQIIPYDIVINGTTYIVRCRLGSIEGVNINLDLATRHRNVKYHRENILKEI